MARQVKEFGVEAEALDGLLLENNGARLPNEGFEAALRIHERQAQDGTDDEIENDAGIFAKYGLTDGDETAIQSARTNGNIVIGKGGEKLFRFFDGCGKIRVSEKHQPALRFQHAAANAVALAAVFGVAQNAKLWDFTTK